MSINLTDSAWRGRGQDGPGALPLLPQEVHRDGRNRHEAFAHPLTKCLLTFRLMAASKKGMSAHQMHRIMGIT